MALSYNPLWKLLIDRGIKKKDLFEKAKISRSTIARMGKDEPVSLTAIHKICKALGCEIEDIVTYLPDKNEQEFS